MELTACASGTSQLVSSSRCKRAADADALVGHNSFEGTKRPIIPKITLKYSLKLTVKHIFNDDVSISRAMKVDFIIFAPLQQVTSQRFNHNA